MAKHRRTGRDSSQTRAVLVDVTERLMRDEGYAAVTSRRVAKEAGVTGALIHYYFPTLDDLFVAVLRRGAETNLKRHARALASPQPLRALWQYSVEPAGAVLLSEFMALGNHRKSIRSEIAKYAAEFRRLEVDALASRMKTYGIDPADVPPEVVVVLFATVSKGIVLEDAVGLDEGHHATRAVVERWLQQLEGDAAT